MQDVGGAAVPEHAGLEAARGGALRQLLAPGQVWARPQDERHAQGRHLQRHRELWVRQLAGLLRPAAHRPLRHLPHHRDQRELEIDSWRTF